MSKQKKRLDQVLVELGLAKSRERAQSLILSGVVLVNDVPVTKAGTSISDEAAIRLKKSDHPYVSRGALKLKKAVEEFKLNFQNKTAIDVGASTGGFTEILLEGGASKVFALDVGHNQLDWKIRNDSRVVVLEKINARTMEFDVINECVDAIVMDVSFISIRKILPNLLKFMKGDADLVTLIKPQFEVGPEFIEKGGIVTSESARQDAIDQVTKTAETLGLVQRGLVESPITGTDGNKEYLAYWKLITAAPRSEHKAQQSQF